MLKKFDQYIIKKYLSTFFFTTLMFTIIALVIDFSERIQDFIEKPITLHQIIFDYYLNFIPWINGLLWPLFSLISVIFFTSRLAKNSEIIATLAAGTSYLRIIRPYMIAALMLAIVLFIGNHYVIPQGNKTFKAFENKYIYTNNEKIKSENIHLFIGPDTKIFLRSYRKRDTSGTTFRLEKFQDNQLVYMIKAGQLKWLGPPNHWQLKNYEIRTFQGDEESLVLGRGKTIDTSFLLYPRDFVRFTNQREMMTTGEMVDFIKYEQQKGLDTARSFKAELHRRSAEPVTIIILSLIGCAIASRKVRGGMGLHLAMGVLVGALYIIMSKFSITFATNLDLSAWVAMWLPNAIFGVLALFLVIRAQQ
jgi:lipopolysaccharide export system permease protein